MEDNPQLGADVDNAKQSESPADEGVVREAGVNEQRLQEQAEWLRVILAVVSDAVIATDAAGQVTSLNAVAQQMTGWSQAEAQGLPLPAVFCILDEQSRQPVENPVAKVLREGITAGANNHTVLISRQGRETPIDDSAAPIRDAAGQIIGVVLVFRDVTAQRRSAQEVRVSEARNSAILETALDCIITMDSLGKVVEFNPAAERTFGYRRAEVIGQELCELIIPVALRERHRRGLSHYLATEEGPVLGKRIELPALRADGTEFPAEVAITRISVEGPPLFTAYLRDISEQKQIERFRLARLAATRALSEAANIEEGASGVIQALCENLNWDLGFLWMVDQVGTELSCVSGWRSPDLQIPEFESDSFNRKLGRGEGLPGHVWLTGKPRWMLDVVSEAAFVRAKSAAKHNLRSAVACPVIVGERTLGVIEFFTQRLREPAADLLELISTLGGSLGQFLERKHNEEQVRRSEQELADFFEKAPVGLHWVDAGGKILRVNQAELDMLGYSRQEYIGQSAAAFHADELAKEFILEHLRTGQPLVECSARLRCKDGTIKDVVIDSSARWNDGRYVHSWCIMRDITERKQAELALQASEQRFVGFMHHLPGLAWIKDMQGRYVYANAAAEKAFRTPLLELYGKTDDEIFPPLTAMQFKLNDQQAMTNPAGVKVIEALENEDGVVRYSIVSKFPFVGADSQMMLVGGMAVDITDQRWVEQALRQSEERLRLALDAGRMGVWDWNIKTGKIDWSESLEAMHGFAPGTFGGTFEEFQRLIHPEDRERVEAAIAAAVNQLSGYDVEFRCVWPNGSTHWSAGKGKVFTNDAGEPERMIGICMDITDRQRSVQTARFLADASAALAVLVDFDSTLQKVCSLAVPHFADWATVDLAESDGELRRVAVAHIDSAKVELAHELHRRFPPDPKTPHGAWEILRTGQSELVPDITDEMLVQSTQEAELLDILRELGLKSYIGVPLKVRNKTLGVITFIAAESGVRYDEADLAVAQDLASRAAIAIENAQLYRELRDADRRKDEFLATLAHELRNPLAPIRNGLQVMRLSGSDAGMIAEARSMMERQLNHMVRLVDDLLDVSRITRNKLDLRKQRVELASVLHSAIETSRPLIEHSRHTFSVNMPTTPIFVNADPVRLSQAFSNLLNNSAKYTEPGGKVSLQVELAEGFVVVRINDNGLGIPADALPRLFQMFSQVDRNMEHAQGGLGIGLTLVRRLVELHGGTVAASSGGPGKGSEFVVQLPTLNLPEEVLGNQLPEKQASGMNSKRRILVVDDNQDSALSLAMMLNIMGHEVQTAHDGLAAIESASEFLPDIILLDIGLPKLNGYEACRRIREQPWSAHMVIVALTGWGQDEDRRRSAEAGFDHHFVKPVEITALQGLLASESRRP